jgi:thiol-disulfide isomerase/thioredoxin
VLFAWFFAVPCFAVGQAFDQATFDGLVKSGKPMLVMIHADWCPTCRAEAAIVADLLKSPPLSGISVLRVDFDRQTGVVKAFGAKMQSTLIVFRNGREIARSVGDSNRDSIEALLRRAI